MSRDRWEDRQAKKVQILMSTYNGEAFIREQLDSLLAQSYPNIDILIRDDGSSDNTFLILKEYEEKRLNILAYQGENIGVNKSFFQLLQKSDAEAAYIGFCDQDDYWFPEKVERAVQRLEGATEPFLYCGAKILVDESLKPLANQQRFCVVPGFGNAVVESICSGCTLLMNRELAAMIKERLPEDAVHHDWWCYLAATYLGDMYYDENAYIYYRQHKGNEVGASGSALAMMRAKARDLKKRRGDLKKQLSDFHHFYHSKPEKDDLVKAILKAETFPARWKILFDRRWYRQSKLDHWIVRGLFLLNAML